MLPISYSTIQDGSTSAACTIDRPYLFVVFVLLLIFLLLLFCHISCVCSLPYFLSLLPLFLFSFSPPPSLPADINRKLCEVQGCQVQPSYGPFGMSEVDMYSHQTTIVFFDGKGWNRVSPSPCRQALPNGGKTKKRTPPFLVNAVHRVKPAETCSLSR